MTLGWGYLLKSQKVHDKYCQSPILILCKGVYNFPEDLPVCKIFGMFDTERSSHGALPSLQQIISSFMITSTTAASKMEWTALRLPLLVNALIRIIQFRMLQLL